MNDYRNESIAFALATGIAPIFSSADNDADAESARAKMAPLCKSLAIEVRKASRPLALAQAVRARWPAVKVLFMSGYTDASIVRQSDLEEGVGYVAKPFEVEYILNTLDQLLAEVVGLPRIDQEPAGRGPATDLEPAVGRAIRAGRLALELVGVAGVTRQHRVRLLAAVAAEMRVQQVDHGPEVAAFLDVHLEEVAHVVERWRSLAEMTLLLDACGLGVALDDDEAAQHQTLSAFVTSTACCFVSWAMPWASSYFFVALSWSVSSRTCSLSS